MITLTLEQILQIHVLVVEQTGGSQGLRDLGRLEAVLATQTQTVMGDEAYPTIYEKSAAVIMGIIANHPFIDGNKRTAMLAGLTLLSINNTQFVANPGEIEDFAVKIATEHLAVPDIANWLKEHCR